ncbi:MAG: heavy metal-responsive transcriptional regulator [Cyanosarcina radialis HA8281-LM2]|jgi:DNA-binding transcriptional MerR regulator|nr:heavy metal-responsive transcriptional regulator [Cyanosarcina radialis HA8281-LM2]
MLAQKQKPLLIGQVAEQSGIPIGTIRYYEALGLLKSSGRTGGGFRQFSPQILTRLEFIKRAQSLGLSLEEIREILQVYDLGKPPCGEIKEKLEGKLLEIDCQIQQLLTLRAELQELLLGWQSLPELQNEVICPIIQADNT